MLKISGFVKISLITVFITLSTSTHAISVTVLDTASFATGGSYTLGNFSTDQDPLGQSFTLNQSLDSLLIGGVFQDVNPLSNPTFDITISLVSGAGTGGALLGSQSFSLTDGFDGLHTEDFSFLGTLLPGTYTALFSSGGTARGALGVTNTGIGDPNSNPYNENGLFTIFNDNTRDFQVLVEGNLTTVPLPAALPLFGSTLIGLVGLRQRKKLLGANSKN